MSYSVNTWCLTRCLSKVEEKQRSKMESRNTRKGLVLNDAKARGK